MEPPHELHLPNAGIMVRDRKSHRIRGWQEEPCLENRSSPEIGNRSLTSTPSYEDWSLTTLKEKLIKIGAKVVTHGRYIAFQMAEAAISRNLFADILRPIAELRPPPDPSPA
jgi:Transposase DDE domain group 1